MSSDISSQVSLASQGETGEISVSSSHHIYPSAVAHPLVSPSNAIVKLTNVHRSFDLNGSVIPALKKVTIAFPACMTTAVTGLSGCGKSTLLSCIAGQDAVSSGHIVVDSHPISAMSRKDLDELRGRVIGFITPRQPLLPSLTIRSHITFHADMAGRHYDEARFDALVSSWGLQDVLDAYPTEVSLQDKLCVVAVRELLENPPVLLMDMPQVDPASPSFHTMMTLIQQDCAKNRRTFIYATSQPHIAALADDVVFMYQGDVVAQMHDPTSQAVSHVLNMLPSWDPATAFRPVKDLLPQHIRNDLYGASSHSIFSSGSAGIWPVENTVLREKIKKIYPTVSSHSSQLDSTQDLHDTSSVSASSSSDKVVSAQDASTLPPGTTDTDTMIGGFNLSGLLNLIPPANTVVPSDFAEETIDPQIPPSTSSSRFIPLDSPKDTDSSYLSTDDSHVSPSDTSHASSDDTEANAPVQATSMQDISAQVVAMKARLHAMTERSQRRLASLETTSYRALHEPLHSSHADEALSTSQSVSPPEPSSRQHSSQRVAHFHQTQEERWKHLLSVFADGDGEDNSQDVSSENIVLSSVLSTQQKNTVSTGQTHVKSPIERAQETRRAQLMEMMRKAEQLLSQSDAELLALKDDLKNSH